MTGNPEAGLVIQDITSPQQITGRMDEVYREGFGAKSVYGEEYQPGEARDILADVIGGGGVVRIGVEEGGRIVAITAAATRDDTDRMVIEELVVDPQSWGRGYGRQMLADILDQAATRGYEKTELRTSIKNSRAKRMYERAGFGEMVGNVLVPQTLVGGKIGVDERVYMARPPSSTKEQTARYGLLRRVVIGYPSGNTTAVIFDQVDQFPGVDRKQLNRAVMEACQRDNPDNPEIEQCCFVTLPRDPRAVCRLEMLGGEFCGNATRTVAWLVTGGKDYKGLIEVSGVDRPLNFTVRDGVVGVEMPLPGKGKLVQDVGEGSLVSLDGISQLVVTDDGKRQACSARELLSSLLAENKYGLAEQPAVGVSYYDIESGKAEFCVWVNAVDTIFDETACGSGTSAIGITIGTKRKSSVGLMVVQPSGEVIMSSARFERGKIRESIIAGTVGVLRDGALRLR